MYRSLDIVRVIKSRRVSWVGNVARMETRIGLSSILVESPEGRIPLKRPRHKRDDNIKMELRAVLWEE